MQLRNNGLCLLTLAILLTPVPVGCSRGLTQQPEQQSSNVVVDRENDPLRQTPAERNENYRRAYAEGLRLVENGEYGLAIGAFELAVQLRGDSTEALFNLGACNEAIGDPLRAINYYRRVLDMNPGDADCYRNLGTSFIKLYYRENSPSWKRMALDAWRRSLELNPEQPDVRRYLVEVPSDPSAIP